MVCTFVNIVVRILNLSIFVRVFESEKSGAPPKAFISIERSRHKTPEETRNLASETIDCHLPTAHPPQRKQDRARFRVASSRESYCVEIEEVIYVKKRHPTKLNSTTFYCCTAAILKRCISHHRSARACNREWHVCQVNHEHKLEVKRRIINAYVGLTERA